MNYVLIGLVVLIIAFQIYRQFKIKGIMPQVIKEGALFIDVRTPEEFASAHHEKSINIPLQEIESRMHEIPKDKNIVLFCRSGNRSGMAKSILDKNGYTKTFNLGPWTNLESALKGQEL